MNNTVPIHNPHMNTCTVVPRPFINKRYVTHLEILGKPSSFSKTTHTWFVGWTKKVTQNVLKQEQTRAKGAFNVYGQQRGRCRHETLKKCWPAPGSDWCWVVAPESFMMPMLKKLSLHLTVWALLLNLLDKGFWVKRTLEIHSSLPFPLVRWERRVDTLPLSQLADLQVRCTLIN